MTEVELKQKILENEKACITGDIFTNGVIFVLDEVSPVIVKLKHSTGVDAHCRGNIENGVCRGCGSTTVGVLAYSFTMVIRDIKDSTVKLKVGCSASAGESLFKKSADEYFKMDRNTHDTLFYSVFEEPFYGGIKLNFDQSKEETFVLCFGCEQLPPSVLRQ